MAIPLATTHGETPTGTLSLAAGTHDDDTGASSSNDGEAFLELPAPTRDIPDCRKSARRDGEFAIFTLELLAHKIQTHFNACLIVQQNVGPRLLERRLYNCFQRACSFARIR